MPINPQELMMVVALAGGLAGLLLGRLLWGRRAKPASIFAAAPARDDAARLERELAAAKAQVRPLAEEVDRLKRELVRARRAEPAALPAPDPTALDIRQLKGVGDKFAQALAAIGLGSVAALAAMDDAAVAQAETGLGVFNGRLKRDRLVEQAQLLGSGRVTEYEARFGKLGGAVR